jgi:ABC-type polysaccharide/polyol phosphate transport system ATPase subunit
MDTSTGRLPSVPRAAVRATNITVEYPIYDPTHRSLRHVLMLTPIANMMRGTTYVGGTIAASKTGVVVVRAINNMSFEIKAGERIGLVGHNGAGKTTLLRTLCGIYEPIAGKMETVGRIMPLFNLMEGLMADSNGREFIRVRGVLLGLDPHEIDAMSEEVIDFCELGGYIDMPVRTYSTGMLVRLAFAIATSVTSDILLFDELIGAGDERFMKKAEARLKRFVEQSSIVVVASHSAAVIQHWCSRAFLLEHGQLVHDGTVAETAKAYQERRTAEGG